MNKAKIQILVVPIVLCACTLKKENAQEIKSHIHSQKDSKAIESSTHPNQYLADSVDCQNDSNRYFYNDSSEGDHYVHYNRKKEFDSEYGYFFERVFYEGRDWIFLSRKTCFETALFGEVSFNPSKNRFASIGIDNAAGYSANGIQIFSLSNESGNAEKEIEDTFSNVGESQFGPTQWRWKSDSTFSVLLMDLDSNSMGREYNYVDGKWKSAD